MKKPWRLPGSSELYKKLREGRQFGCPYDQKELKSHQAFDEIAQSLPGYRTSLIDLAATDPCMRLSLPLTQNVTSENLIRVEGKSPSQLKKPLLMICASQVNKGFRKAN
jgi:hypothetical protein